MKLTQDQIDAFRRDGFLRFGRILDEEAVSVLRQEYDRVFREAEESEDKKARFLTANGGDSSEPKAVLQITQMCERNLHFRRLLYHSDILDVVEDLIGPNIQLFHDQALFKPPHTGGPVPWHQDNSYWHCRPANLLSCWLTLDDVDVKMALCNSYREATCSRNDMNRHQVCFLSRRRSMHPRRSSSNFPPEVACSTIVRRFITPRPT